MGVLDAVSAFLAASTRSTNRGGGRTTDTPAGAYWCDDCTERVPASDAGEEPPDCPDCGDQMTFERSPGTTGCAC